ncbi:MAG: flavin reductase [Geminicoccaceae bacterium]|nr:flavin reductase [Geminicoccaceae bacterium]
MSRTAASVNVVTTDGPAGRAGITVSAMSAVSADAPRPSLLVCIHHASRASKAIIANECFCVNLLRADQAHVSDVFAGRRKTADGDKFTAGTWTAMATGAPRFVDPLVAFDCRLDQHMQVGTHHVFFGAVEEIFAAEAGPALLYANRAYGTSPHIGPIAGESEQDAPGLSIGCETGLGPTLVATLLSRLQTRVGAVETRLDEGTREPLLERLAAGDLDLALLTGAHEHAAGDPIEVLAHIADGTRSEAVLVARRGVRLPPMAMALAEICTEVR